MSRSAQQPLQLNLWHPEVPETPTEHDREARKGGTAATPGPEPSSYAVSSASGPVTARVMLSLTRSARPHLRRSLQWDQRQLDRWRAKLADTLPPGLLMQVTVHDRWRERFKLASVSQTQQIVSIHWALLADSERVLGLLEEYSRTRKVSPEDHQWASELTVPQDTPRVQPSTPVGVHFDLRGCLQRLLDRMGEYEDTTALGAFDVSWSPAPPREGRHGSIRLGSCDHGRHRILLNPKLDDARVPRYVVESVLWHEMAHVLRPPVRKGKRREVHHAEFQALDRLFSEHEEARSWVAANIGWLLQ